MQYFFIITYYFPKAQNAFLVKSDSEKVKSKPPERFCIQEVGEGWWVRFAFIIHSTRMINICSHQFSNWWQQLSAGQLHLDGFESHHPHRKQKHLPLWLVFCFGGGWWIRTIEAKRSRFTVCPLWPLGKSPIFSCCLLEPVDGLEPPTY